MAEQFSSPFIEERLYFLEVKKFKYGAKTFSSPFIEERLYLKAYQQKRRNNMTVLVPFYRGAVVF